MDSAGQTNRRLGRPWTSEAGHLRSNIRGGARKAAEKSIQMSEIMATLEKKGARLTITISDSCNEDAELKMPKGTAAKRGKDKLAEAFAKLFVLARGYIRISSTKPGELAWGDSDVGGVFSYLLITVSWQKHETKVQVQSGRAS